MHNALLSLLGSACWQYVGFFMTRQTIITRRWQKALPVPRESQKKPSSLNIDGQNGDNRLCATYGVVCTSCGVVYVSGGVITAKFGVSRGGLFSYYETICLILLNLIIANNCPKGKLLRAVFIPR
jgi:hypothetical protein